MTVMEAPLGQSSLVMDLVSVGDIRIVSVTSKLREKSSTFPV